MRDQNRFRLKDFEQAAKNLPIIQENNINVIGSYCTDWIMQDAPQEIAKQKQRGHNHKNIL